MRTKIKDLKLGELVTVKGWVRTVRDHRKIGFIHIQDGSTHEPLQIVFDPQEIKVDDIHTGCSISVEGYVERSIGSGQEFDVTAKSIKLIGKVDKYPIQPKKHSMEFFRGHSHLRMRSDLFKSIFRVRSVAADSIHRYFQDKGYTYVHTPIITGSDCEGAGETFELDKEFFGREASLTVSGQLHGETAMMGLGDIYTFGPTFRAEQSFTTRHLSEFWMVEPELPFVELSDIVDLSEDFIKEVIKMVMVKCEKEIEFLRKFKLDSEKQLKKELRSMDLIEKLEMTLSDFTKITYTEAISVLKSSKLYKKGKFEYPVEWGLDLKAEHEKFLVKKFDSPVIITDYPKDCKAFYMKVDGDTVRAMDVLLPEVGEIIGGSQREDDIDVLISRMKEVGIETDKMSWYLDTRRFGSVPHGGFGLGFERLVQYITGVDSIKDVCLYPVSAKYLKY